MLYFTIIYVICAVTVSVGVTSVNKEENRGKTIKNYSDKYEKKIHGNQNKMTKDFFPYSNCSFQNRKLFSDDIVYSENNKIFSRMRNSQNNYLGRLLLRRDLLRKRKRKRNAQTRKRAYESVFAQKMKEFRDKNQLNNPEPLGTNIQDADFQRTNLPEPVTIQNTSKTPISEQVPTDRLLSIRHSLRNYLTRTNSWNASTKKNRCRRFDSDAETKPPLMCVPFIQAGEDRMLKRMIEKLQTLLERRSRRLKVKTTTEKIEIFGQIKFKPKNKKKKKPKSTFENVLNNDTTTTESSSTATEDSAESLPPVLRFDPIASPPLEYPTISNYHQVPIPPIPAPDLDPGTFPPWPTKPNTTESDTEPPIIYCPDKTDSEPESSDPSKEDEENKEDKEEEEEETATKTATATKNTTTTTAETTTTTATLAPEESEDEEECGDLHPSDEDVVQEVKQNSPPPSPPPKEETCPKDSDSDEDVLYDYDISVETTPCILTKPRRKRPKCRKSGKKKKHPRSKRNSFTGENLHDALKPVVEKAAPSKPSKNTTTTTVATTEQSTTVRSTVSTDPEEPTTMKPAGIVKAPKRTNGRPVPKSFPRIYPSSMAMDNSTSANGSSVTSNNEKSSIAGSSEKIEKSSPTDIHLKLLAVCESYLEVIKLIKAHNESFPGELDFELIRYCENIISKSFDPPEKTGLIRKRSVFRREKPLHDKVLVDILRSPIYRKQMMKYSKQGKPQKGKSPKGDLRLLHLLRKRKNSLLSKYRKLMNKEKRRKPSANIMHDTRINKKMEDGKNLYPIYASQYDYNKGGKVREVEVLWRQFDEKNRKKEIVKNLTVLALMPSFSNTPEIVDGNDAKFAEDEDEDDEMINNSSMNGETPKGLEEAESDDNKTSTVTVTTTTTKSKSKSTTTTTTPRATTKVANETANNGTSSKPKTFINKPDPSSILGNPPEKKTQASKVAYAKEIFQEYMIEFLNYAVYIIPIMFLSLFVICCLCCFIKMFATKKKKKKRKRDRKLSDETSESSTAPESKSRNKRLSSLEKKVDEIFKLLNEKQPERVKNSNGDDVDEDIKPSKKKKLLRFLSKRKRKKLINSNYIPLENIGNSENDLVEVTDSDLLTSDSEGKKDEAKERKELITLLKKLDQINESENGNNKKPVIVQYVTEATSPTLILSDEEPEEERFLYKKPPDVFERFRCIGEDMTKELIKGSPNDTANKFNLLGEMFQRFPPPNLSPTRKISLTQEMENFKRLLNRKRFVHLTDNGVLCRL